MKLSELDCNEKNKLLCDLHNTILAKLGIHDLQRVCFAVLVCDSGPDPDVEAVGNIDTVNLIRILYRTHQDYLEAWKNAHPDNDWDGKG